MRPMNCDQVFDILTRGPFPTGTSCDEPVEAHLNACPQCHRLAEALRPALELFQEAVDPEESRDLPGYWTGAATERQQAILSYATDFESRRAAPRAPVRQALGAHKARLSALIAWRMAAMLALGVTLGSLVSDRVAFNGFTWPPLGVNAAAPIVPRPDQPRLTLIELAALPAACFRNQSDDAARISLGAGQLPSSAELASLCCTGCHNSTADAVPRVATVKVAQSCQLCHQDQPVRRFEPAP